MMNGLEGEGVDEFNHLLQQAALLKTEQLAVDRRRFDGYPEWLQHTMFADPEQRQLRDNAAFADRIAAAERFKLEGNRMLAAGEHNHALLSYGDSLGLFRWLKNADPNWKKKAINDKDISEHCWLGYTGEEKAAVRTHLLACYLNLSLLYGLMGRWADAVRAADEAIRLQPRSAKAHYRKAMALCTPLSAGATEQLLALRALKCAADIEPSNIDIRCAFETLHGEVEKQKEKDKAAFKGFLRPERYRSVGFDAPQSCRNDSPHMSVKEAYTQLQDMESVAARHYDSGLYAEAEELRLTVARVRTEVDQFVACQRHGHGETSSGNSSNEGSETQDPEMAKALAVATRFVSDLSPFDVKAMLRARGENTDQWLPWPVLGTPTTLLETIKYGWYWTSYVLRANVRAAEYICDLWNGARSVLPLISTQEDDFFRDILINRFSMDIYTLKMNSSSNEARSDLLQQLIKQYENVGAGPTWHLPWEGIVAVFVLALFVSGYLFL